MGCKGAFKPAYGANGGDDSFILPIWHSYYCSAFCSDMGEIVTNFVHNFESEDLQPYVDGECRHTHRVDNKGVLTCKDCGATYNESTLEWGEE